MKNILIILLCFSIYALKGQCVKTLVPMSSQPSTYGTANDYMGSTSRPNYVYYSQGQKSDPTYGYLNIITPKVWNNTAWSDLTSLDIKGTGHLFEWGNRWVYGSINLRYANGIKAPVGKQLGPLVLKGSKWDTLPGTLIDSGIYRVHYGTKHHIFCVEQIGGYKSQYYQLYNYDTTNKKFQKLYRIKAYNFPKILVTADRCFIVNADSIGNNRNSTISFIDSNLKLHVLNLGIFFNNARVTGVEYSTNRIYLYELTSNPTVYEIDTSIVASRKTVTSRPVYTATSNNYFASISNGSIMWDMYSDGITPETRGYFLLCPGETKWTFIEVSRNHNIAPYIMNSVVGTPFGFYALENANNKVVTLGSAYLFTGSVWGDLDSNCTKTKGDVPYKLGIVGVHKKDFGAVSSTDEFGNYEMLLPNGNYKFNRHELAYAPCFNDSITINSDSSRDVCLLLKAKTDLKIHNIFGFSWRWNTRRHMVFSSDNMGKYCDSGIFKLTLDSGIYVTLDSNQTYDSTTRTVSIKVKNLVPLDHCRFTVLIQHDTALFKPNSTTHYHASFYPACPEMDSTDNDWYGALRLVYSLDPNYMDVSETKIKPMEEKKLQYYIHFQNEGSDYAEDVELRDTLSPYVNMESLQVVGASFPYQMTVTGRILTVKFKGIHLLPKKQNEALSEGFFTYSIKTSGNLALGTIIQNRAGIYFDLNKPVITNTAYTVVEWPAQLKSIAHGSAMKLYPNPSKDWITIRSAGNVIGSDILLYSATGQLLKEFNRPEGKEIRLNISSLPNGMYFLKMGTETAGFIKQ